MGQARRRKLAGTYPAQGEVDIIGVGFGGLCGECDEIHPVEPQPFLYTVGLTEQALPELLLVVPGVPELMATALAQSDLDHVEDAELFAGMGRVLAKSKTDLLNSLATLQRRRRRAFDDGEHLHKHEIGGAPCCVKLIAAEPSEEFPLGEAIQRYGSDGFGVLQVLLYDATGGLQNDPLSVWAAHPPRA